MRRRFTKIILLGLCIYLCVLLLLVGGCGSTKPDVDLSLLFEHEWKGNIDKGDIAEPSGIVFHAQRGTLFVVGDEGDIIEMTTKGKHIKAKRLLEQGDYEGITVDPSTGLLYVAIEDDETIIEIDPETFKIMRRFEIERTYREKLVMKKGNQGIEGITFIPDVQSPQGGTFFI